MEEVITIKAETRQEVGKKISKKLRKEGQIPAIIYGKGQKEAMPISLPMDEIKRIMKSEKRENTALRIEKGDLKVDAMIHDIQYDCITDRIIHVDLLRIDLEKPVNVNVPIVITGEPVGVKIEGGILDFTTREIRVRCLVTRIPRQIVVDVSGLHTGDTIKVESLAIDEDVKLISEPHTVICSVSTRGKAGEEEAEGAVAAVAAAPVTPGEPK